MKSGKNKRCQRLKATHATRQQGLLPFLSIITLCFTSPTCQAEDGAWVATQVAPTGYSGAINTPMAYSIPWGTANASISNSIPERTRTIGEGHFGGLNVGFGILPGLELFGRLNYEGDLDCNQYLASCNSKTRDLSVGGKYELPFKLPLDTRLAFGGSDYGGAATNHRQVYAVATSEQGPFHVSLGYSRGESGQSMMDGVFGSAVVRVTERLTAAIESDTHEKRLGLHYRQPIADQLDLQFGYGRKLTESSGQRPWQATASLLFKMGQVSKHETEPSATDTNTVLSRKTDASLSQPSVAKVSSPASLKLTKTLVANSTTGKSAEEHATSQQDSNQPDQTRADTLAHALVKAGFSQITVQYWSANKGVRGLWWVRAEPRSWRQRHQDGLAIGLGQWLKQNSGNDSDDLLFTLTYQREATTSAYTNTACLKDWLMGWQQCELGDALQFSHARRWPESLAPRLAVAPTLEARAEGQPAWTPQLEIGPNLRNTVGTEYGLYDYSLAMDFGAEINLLPGLSWQGIYSVPVSNSEDFDDTVDYGGQSYVVFGAQKHPPAGVDASLLSYLKSWPRGITTQLSAGLLSRTETGVMADAAWVSPNRRWRLGASAGSFESDTDSRQREPLLASMRYSLVPGIWQIEAMAGQFMGGDQGFKLASMHWFGRSRMQIFYRSSASSDETVMPQRDFMGFIFSVPLGPAKAFSIGPMTIRGRDQWGWGLETKVGESDNRLTQGYGVFPRARHGLWTDNLDYDRSGDLGQTPMLQDMQNLISAQLKHN